MSTTPEALRSAAAALIARLGNAPEAAWLAGNLRAATTRDEILRVLLAADNQVTLARAYGDLDD